MSGTDSTLRLSSRRGLFAAACAAAMLVSGCGFQLRQAPVFAFKTLAVPGKSIFTVYLRRNLRATGTVTIVPDEEMKTADAVLDVLSENRENIIISANSAGQVRELQLRLTVRFRVRTPAGRELLGPTEIQQQRDITYNETAALAKEGETELLYRDMQSDIAQQTMRRLAAIKSL